VQVPILTFFQKNLNFLKIFSQSHSETTCMGYFCFGVISVFEIIFVFSHFFIVST